MLPFAASIYARSPKTQMPKRLIKPKRLYAGDTVAVIAPSSGISAKGFEKGLKHLESLGFKPKVGEFARGKNGFLAATDAERLKDLHWAFSDNDVKGVWCIRGGYGAARLLPFINYNIIKRNPKVFIGYSDITALHMAFHYETGLVTFHGPVAASTFTDYTRANCLNVLMNPQNDYVVKLSPPTKPEPEIDANPEDEAKKTKEPPVTLETITAGVARGRLIGGNLSLVSSLAGTKYGLNKLKNNILFLEDVGELPYRIDRMLTQLLQSADLKSLSGIALGHFTDAGGVKEGESQTVLDVLRDRLGNLGIPVIYGLSFGHINDQFTLPEGIQAELDTKNATVTFLETAVR